MRPKTGAPKCSNVAPRWSPYPPRVVALEPCGARLAADPEARAQHVDDEAWGHPIGHEVTDAPDGLGGELPSVEGRREGLPHAGLVAHAAERGVALRRGLHADVHPPLADALPRLDELAVVGRRGHRPRTVQQRFVTLPTMANREVFCMLAAP